MRTLSITSNELPGLHIAHVANSPDIFCTFNAQELVDHDGAVGVEVCGRYVGGVWSQAEGRDVHVCDEFGAGGESQLFAPVGEGGVAFDFCLEL